MNRLIFSVSGLLLALLSAPLAAQEITPIRMENTTYQVVQYYKFKPGKHFRAEQIIRDVYLAADRKAGGNVRAIFMMTGEWDAVILQPMNGGIEDLTYAVSPHDVKWIAAMVQQLGDEQKVREIIDEFDSLIEREVRHIGRSPETANM